jgi:ABC-type nitrate/sulfonate/bicarbonate transport system substrate-binding protein
MRPSAARVLALWRRRLRPIAAVLAGLVPLLVITGCNPFSSLSSSSSGQVIRVAAVPGIDNANLYLAVHSGYFTRAGVTVKIEKYADIPSEIRALNQGSVDVIAADYGDMFYAQTQAANPIYQILADGYDAAPGVIEILTMPGSKITTAADLAGLTIPAPNSEQVGVAEGDPSTLAVASAVSVLQSDGVNLAAVTWKPMQQQQEIAELVHHQVPAVLLTGLDVYLAEQQGATALIDACSGPTSGIPLDGFFVTNGWLAEASHATAAKDFQQGLYAADAAATMAGPIQSILHPYAGLTGQEADLVTTGTYPLSTIAANVQRTAGLLWNVGTTKKQVDVLSMVFVPH